jgi:hypothetical protein
VTRGQAAGEIAVSKDTLKRGSRPPKNGGRKKFADLGINDQRLAEWRLLSRYTLDELRAARDRATAELEDAPGT